MLAAYLVNKSLKLIQFLALVSLSLQVSHGRLNNTVSSVASYAEQRIFFSVNGYSPDSVNILQSSIQVNSTVMEEAGYHCASNAISFFCICFGRTVP